MKRIASMIAPLIMLAWGGLAYGQPRYDPGSVDSLIAQVHTDLNRAYGAWHFTNGDRGRLNHAEKELRDFAHKWRDNHFDKGELDDAISSVQHVLDNNHMPEQVRGALNDDVSQLRGMREAYDHHELGR